MRYFLIAIEVHGRTVEGYFKQLKVDLLYSTAYHPQTDGSSEITNQTAEIALRHWLMTLKEPKEWVKVLLRLQVSLNNSNKYSSTTLSPNQVLFGFCTREPLDLIHMDEPLTMEADIPTVEADVDANHSSSSKKSANTTKPVRLAAVDQYRPAHIDAKDAIAFAAMRIKHYYESKHKPQFFKKGDMVNLRLHRGYSLPGQDKSMKISQPFVGPLRVLERIGRLTYHLEIPEPWKIHDVISIAHLEPATNPQMILAIGLVLIILTQ